MVTTLQKKKDCKRYTQARQDASNTPFDLGHQKLKVECAHAQRVSFIHPYTPSKNENEILIYSFETNVNHHDIQFQQYRLGENKSKQQKHNSFGLTNLLGRK